MIIVQVVKFAVVSRPYLGNYFQAFLDFIYFVYIRDSYSIPVRKIIIGNVMKE
jgi:hypothetical protein